MGEWGGPDACGKLCLYRVQDGKAFRGGRGQEVAVGTSEADLQTFLVQEQGARKMDRISAPEGMVLAERRHELEHCSSDWNLLELLPIVGEALPELLKLGVHQKLFSSSASERRVDFGKGQNRNSHGLSLPHSLAHSL